MAALWYIVPIFLVALFLVLNAVIFFVENLDFSPGLLFLIFSISISIFGSVLFNQEILQRNEALKNLRTAKFHVIALNMLEKEVDIRVDNKILRCDLTKGHDRWGIKTKDDCKEIEDLTPKGFLDQSDFEK